MVNKQSLEDFGGVLAAPPRGVRRRTTAAAALVALAAAAIIIVVVHVAVQRPAASLVATLAGPSGSQRASAAAFSPDGKTLAILGGNGSTGLWDVATKRWIATLTSPQCRGRDAQILWDRDAQILFSPDGKTLAVIGSPNGRTGLWMSPRGWQDVGGGRRGRRRLHLEHRH